MRSGGNVRERMAKCVGWWHVASWILSADDEERNKHLATTVSVLHRVGFQRIDGMRGGKKIQFCYVCAVCSAKNIS